MVLWRMVHTKKISYVNWENQNRIYSLSWYYPPRAIQNRIAVTNSPFLDLLSHDVSSKCPVHNYSETVSDF